MRRETTVTIEPREEGITTQRYAVLVGEQEHDSIKVVRGPGYWTVFLGKARRHQCDTKVEVLEVLRRWLGVKP